MPKPESGKKRAGMPLRVVEATAIGGAMKLRGISACLGLALLLPACRKPEEVTVDESRPATMRDEKLKIGATSNERFTPPAGAGAAPAAAADSPVIATMTPEGWKTQPASAFRLLNYSFGTAGEVWVSISAGDIPSNVNRWLGQFKNQPLDDGGIAALEKVVLLGVPGVWIEAKGEYLPGMGQPARPDQALAGVIVQRGSQIVTVKMVGPVAEVEAQKPALRQYVAGLQARSE